MGCVQVILLAIPRLENWSLFWSLLAETTDCKSQSHFFSLPVQTVVGGLRHAHGRCQLVREQKRKDHVVELNGGWQSGKWLLVIGYSSLSFHADCDSMRLSPNNDRLTCPSKDHAIFIHLVAYAEICNKGHDLQRCISPQRGMSSLFC